jgi:erythromycin esterase
MHTKRMSRLILAVLTLCMAEFAEAASTLYLPRQFNPSEMATVGVAFLNPTAAAAAATFKLRTADGATAVSSQRTIPANGQLSLTLNQLFPAVTVRGWLSADIDVDRVTGFWLAGDFVTSVDGAPLLNPDDAAASPGFAFFATTSEISFVNIGSNAVAGNLRLLNASGIQVAAAPFELAVFGVFQQTVASLFPAQADSFGADTYWISVSADSANARLIGTAVTPRADADKLVTNLLSVSSDRFVIPHIVGGRIAGATYESTIILTNLQPSSQSVTLTLRQTAGPVLTAQRTIPGNGVLRSSAVSLFGASSVDGWLLVEATMPVSGVVTYSDAGNGGGTAVEMQAGAADIDLAFGHIANLPPWSTGIALANPSATDAQVEIYAIDPSGNLIGGPSQAASASFVLPAQSKRAFLLSEVIPQIQTRSTDGGYVYVRSTNGIGLHGSQLFFRNSGLVYANVPAAPLRDLAFTTPAARVISPAYLNLDFETEVRSQAWGWSAFGVGFEFSLDKSESQSGAQSFRIRNINAPASTLANAGQQFPIELVRGKRVRVSGWIKTLNANSGAAGIWWRVDGANGFLSIDNAPPAGLPPLGTTQWTRYEFERYVDPNGVAIFWGVFFRGSGTAWFDRLEIEIDGVPLAPEFVPDFQPTETRLDWIRNTAIPFNGDAPRRGYEDLLPLKDVVGNARIVALGEGTHGTREFFRMKHRLLEFLATEMGFTIFSIEANMPEAYRLNEYVLTGVGDPKQLLKGMYFWTWNTQEVLDMILWMREFNLSGKGRVEFTGFDMQTPTVAIQVVRDFVSQYDREALVFVNSSADSANMAASTANRGNTGLAAIAASAWLSIVERLTGNREQYASAGAQPGAIAWALQNARVVLQSMQMRSNAVSRDESMAKNVEWILDQSPGAKIVLWAHNFHVSRQAGAQGSYLARRYGKDYLPIEFAFHEGRYNAVGNPGPLGPHNAAPSFAGSAEYIFHSVGMPQFILDVRKASPDNPASAWLLGSIQFRSIGALAVDGFSTRHDLSKFSDVLIFFDQTRPSALLPF